VGAAKCLFCPDGEVAAPASAKYSGGFNAPEFRRTVKRKSLAGLVVALVFLWVACTGGAGNGAARAKGVVSEPAPGGADAGDLVAALKASGLPIAEVKAYTADDDPEHLLGRPGQYTSKADFRDTRVDGPTIGTSPCDPIPPNAPPGSKPACHPTPFPEVAYGGSIEMFASAGDAKHRYDEATTTGLSDFEEHDYLAGKVLLRLSDGLTPTQTTQYEDKVRNGAARTAPATTRSAPILEAAVRAATSAVFRGDGDAAYGLLSSRCRQKFPKDEFLRAISQTAAKYGAATITSYKGYVNGAIATATYQLTDGSLNRTAERWVLEAGAWHQDEC
jgi:hypothetical protein